MKAKPAALYAFFVGAVCMIFSGGTTNIPILAWIWPACLMYAFRRLRGRVKMTLVSVILLASGAVRFRGYTGTGIGGDLASGAVLSLLVLIPLLADRYFYPRLKEKTGAFSVLLAPLALTAAGTLADLLVSTPALAYSQTGNLPLMQAVSLIGSYGLTFLIYLFASTLLYAFESRRFERRNAKPLFACVLALVLLLVFGGARIAAAPTVGDDSVLIAMALTPEEGDWTKGTLVVPSYEENIAFLKEKCALARAGGAEILLFAEQAFEFDDAEEESYLAEASLAARENGLWVVFTADIHDTDGDIGGRSENRMFLMDPQGNAAGTYAKYKLLPGPLEADEYERGDGEILFSEITRRDGGKLYLSSVICFDSNDGRYLAGMDERTDILLIPAWGWNGCDPSQVRMQAFRAIENGVSMASSAVNAKSVATDWLGNVVCETDEATCGRDALNFARLPLREGTHSTLYHRVAGWIDWAYPAGAALLILISLLPVKKRARRKERGD